MFIFPIHFSHFQSRLICDPSSLASIIGIFLGPKGNKCLIPPYLFNFWETTSNMVNPLFDLGSLCWVFITLLILYFLFNLHSLSLPSLEEFFSLEGSYENCSVGLGAQALFLFVSKYAALAILSLNTVSINCLVFCTGRKSCPHFKRTCTQAKLKSFLPNICSWNFSNALVYPIGMFHPEKSFADIVDLKIGM